MFRISASSSRLTGSRPSARASAASGWRRSARPSRTTSTAGAGPWSASSWRWRAVSGTTPGAPEGPGGLQGLRGAAGDREARPALPRRALPARPPEGRREGSSRPTCPRPTRWWSGSWRRGAGGAADDLGRTKAALAAAKARGSRLGKPKGYRIQRAEETRKPGAEANTKAVDGFADRLRPVIEELAGLSANAAAREARSARLCERAGRQVERPSRSEPQGSLGACVMRQPFCDACGTTG